MYFLDLGNSLDFWSDFFWITGLIASVIAIVTIWVALFR